MFPGMLLAALTLAESSGVPFADDGQAILSPQQVIDSRRRALGGDADASLALSDYYMFVDSDVIESTFWLQLSAEQGSCAAMSQLIKRIENVSYLRRSGRARHWKDIRTRGCAAPER